MADLSVLVINPGSTSSKVAYFRSGGLVTGGDPMVAEENIGHDPAVTRLPLAAQEGLREGAIREFLRVKGLAPPDAVCGRGGPMKAVLGGTYAVDEAMLADLRSARYGEHASLLGGILAERLGREWGVPSFVVDPVSTDEMAAVARISGVPGLERRGRSHALSLKAVARLTAAALGKRLTETRLVAAHLGGGISVAAMTGGRLRDVNDALLGMGPFSPFRAGALPIEGLLALAFAPGADHARLLRRLAHESGLFGYLGTGDLREVEARMDAGDVQAQAIYEAMVYQLVKEIGGMASTLGFEVDGVVLTGGLAHSDRLVADLRARTAPLGPLFVYPGERELEALYRGALRVLTGEEPARRYGLADARGDAEGA